MSRSGWRQPAPTVAEARRDGTCSHRMSDKTTSSDIDEERVRALAANS